MSALASRDLKDITDLVSKKLEIYLNIDERERKFDPQGYYRVSPRMHKYDAMYRLLESTEFEKTLEKTQNPKTPRSKSRNNSPNKGDKSRSRSQIAKTQRNQQNTESKSRPKSSIQNEKKVKTTPKQQTKEKSRSLDRYKYRPIVINTPRTTSSRQTKRLEKYANEVFESHPVRDLQTIHRASPRIPNNGRVHNYSSHVGAALNTKHYVDFYLKTGLDGNKNSPRRKTKEKSESSVKGSVSNAPSDRCSRDRNNGSNSPETDSSRAVVTFKSPLSSVPSESNYKIITPRQESCQDNSSLTPVDDQEMILVSSPDNLIDTLIQERSISTPEPLIHTESRDRSRCKSRISRKTSSLIINYDSESDDPTISKSDKETSDNDEKSTSTRTISPSSTQESLNTPSSYQEVDSSDSSNSSVLRFYRLSTGEVFSPKKRKSPRKEGGQITQVKDSPREKLDYNLTPRKSPERRRRGKPKERPDLNDSTCSSDSNNLQYTLLRPQSRLLKRSSVRSDSMTEDSSDSPRSSTPLVIDKPQRTKSFKKSRERHLIDLNLTAVFKRERSEMSITGTGEDDVFVKDDSQEDFDALKRASDDMASDSRQSRGGCDESDKETERPTLREEYYMLDSNGTPRTPRQISSDISWPHTPPTASPRINRMSPNLVPGVLSPIEPHNLTTYSTSETLPVLDPTDKNVTFNHNETQEESGNRGEMQNFSDQEVKENIKSVQSLAREEIYDRQIIQENSSAENNTDSNKDSSSVSSSEGCQSGSEVYLSRGSDGNGKDGRGKTRKRSASRRPPSRGGQWEDEYSNSGYYTPKYLIGNDTDPDERGDYQYLPENRGIYTEKGYSDGEPEYYTISEYIPKSNTKIIPVNITGPSGGIPPKSRPNVQPTKARPKTAERRGESGILMNSEYPTQAEIYRAISSLKEIEIDLGSNPETVSSERLITPSEDVQHFTFLPDVPSNDPEAYRGEAILSKESRDSDCPVIIRPYQDPSELDTSLVFDMQEKPDEFRGRMDSEDFRELPEARGGKNTILDRGHSRASSFTSTLSWTEKYGSKCEADEKNPTQIYDQSVKDKTRRGVQDVKLEEHGTFTIFPEKCSKESNQGLDEDILTDVKKYYIRSKEEECDQEMEVEESITKPADLMSQLNNLVKAKKMYVEKVQTSPEESGSTRGIESDEDSEPKKKFVLKPQYSSLIHDLILNAPESPSTPSSASSSSEAATESDSSSTTGEITNKTKTSSPVITQASEDNVCREQADPKHFPESKEADPYPTDDQILKNYQSSFLETALGISGDVKECVEPQTPDSKPKLKRVPLTEKDIKVLKSPCLAVAKNEGQTVDSKQNQTKPDSGRRKVNRRVMERGTLEVKKSRRPRSAVPKSSFSSSVIKKRPSSSIYLSA